MPQYTSGQYKCMETNRLFMTEQLAKESEDRHKKWNREDTVLKRNHPDDTEYARHCVDCGIVVIEYEPVVDEPGFGTLLHEITHTYVFNGLRCRGCTDNLKQSLINALEKKKK